MHKKLWSKSQLPKQILSLFISIIMVLGMSLTPVSTLVFAEELEPDFNDYINILDDVLGTDDDFNTNNIDANNTELSDISPLAADITSGSGIHVWSTENGDSWSGANIILGTDASKWPFSTGDVVAFTPKVNTTYRLTFNTTSTGAVGFRVRWISGNENGGYTAGDTAVVNDYQYAADEVAVMVPAYFMNTIANGDTNTYTVEFPMSGSEKAGGLIGNLGIRGQSGSNEFIINTIKIETVDGKVLVNWDKDATGTIPDGSVAGLKWDQYPALKDVYKDYFLFGAMDSPANTMPQDRKNLLDYHFNAITPGNAMKPESTQPTPGVFTFNLIDEILGNIAPGTVKIGHTLGWHSQTPNWFWGGSDYDITREQALANIKTHVDAVLGRFGSELYAMDVVNEAIGSGSNPADWRSMLRQEGWRSTPLGTDWVEEFFKAAADVVDENGWDVKLYYNDFGLDSSNKAQAVYYMVKDINERYADYRSNGKPLIEGIGLQGHYNGQTVSANVEESIKLFASLPNIILSVTELDISYSVTNGIMNEAQEKAQAQKYAELFQIYKKYAAGPANPDESKRYIERVTVGSVMDRNDGGWLSGQAPAVFDMQGCGKEGLLAVLDPENYLKDLDAGPQTQFPQAKAMYGSPVLGANDSLWDKALEFNADTKPVKEPNGMGIDSVATAKMKAMWDEQYLYIRADVKDSLLTQNSSQAHEKDSVEFFISETGNKGASYSGNDNQYRVAYDGEKSIKIGSADSFESYAETTTQGYLLEIKIPFKEIVPKNGASIGFDVQINDVDGTTRKLTVWSALDANGYNTPKYWGTLNLVKATDGIYVYALDKGDGWSGANIILGSDQSQWPWSKGAADGAVAFTPDKDKTYRLTFNATSTGTSGYRVRWIKDNENSNYTAKDGSIVTNAENLYAADKLPDSIPASFTSGISGGAKQTYTVEFKMDGFAEAEGLIGNIAIRGVSGSNAFNINWIQITTLDGELLAEWDGDGTAPLPEPDEPTEKPTPTPTEEPTPSQTSTPKPTLVPPISDNSNRGYATQAGTSPASTATATPAVNAATSTIIVNDISLQVAVTKSEDSSKNTLNLTMNVPSADLDTITSYILMIPSGILSDIRVSGVKNVSLTMGKAQIIILAQDLVRLANANGSISIRIDKVNNSKLDSAVANAAGTGQVYELGLYINNIKQNNVKFQSLVTVKLPYQLKAGEDQNRLAVFYFNPSTGSLEPRSGVYDSAAGSIKFNTISFSTYVVKESKVTFNDISKAEWSKVYVETMASKGIISGRGEGVFDPNTNITRAEFSALLIRMLGGINTSAKAAYSDITPDNPYYTTIASLENLGIKISGRSGNVFAPNDFITREEMFDLIGQALTLKGYSSADTSILDKFADNDGISSYAVYNIALLVKEGIVSGMGDNTLQPKGYSTRAQAAVILYQMLNK